MLDAFLAWLHGQEPKALPKSALGQAVAYSLGQWDKLEAFMLNGRLEMSNNRAERAIKPLVCDRKEELAIQQYPTRGNGQRCDLQHCGNSEAVQTEPVCLPLLPVREDTEHRRQEPGCYRRAAAVLSILAERLQDRSLTA